MELRRDEKIIGDARCPRHPPVNIRQNVVVDGGRWGGQNPAFIIHQSSIINCFSSAALFPPLCWDRRRFLSSTAGHCPSSCTASSQWCVHMCHMTFVGQSQNPATHLHQDQLENSPPQPLDRGPLLFQSCSFRLLLFSIFKRSQN